MLLSYNQLVSLVNQGVVDADENNVNGTSIDLRLGPKLLIEIPPTPVCPECHASFESQRWLIKGVDGSELECPNCWAQEPSNMFTKPIDPTDPEQKLNFREEDCTDGFILEPGDVCLASTVEVFNLPRDVSADYKLKSSMARVFLEHLTAGWCDPGWNGSNLTLELKNMTRYHRILLTAGMKIGQIVLMSHEPVPENRSYRARGQYNGDKGPTPSKGIR